MKKKTYSFPSDEHDYHHMAGLCLVSLIVLAFRYTIRPDCAAVNIVLPDSLVAGNIIRLRAEMPGGEDFSWSFGDGVTRDEKTNATTYTYKTPGLYTIKVLVNGSCEGIQKIYIKEAPVVINTSMLPIIIASDTIYMSEPALFTDIASTSTSWEWYFGETNSLDDTSQEATYTYHTPGIKRILLKVNGRRDLTREKLVYVKDREAERNERVVTPRPAPQPVVHHDIKPDPLPPPLPVPTPAPAPAPEVKKAPDVSTKQLVAIITAIVEDEKGTEAFNPYLCGNRDIKVAYNGTVVSFTKFCETLSGLRRRRITRISVWQNVNAQTNCIESMVVTMETRRRIWPFN